MCFFFIMTPRIRAAIEVVAGRARGCTTKAKSICQFPIWSDVGLEELISIIDVLSDRPFTPWPTCHEVNWVREHFGIDPMELCRFCQEELDAIEFGYEVENSAHR